MAVSPLHVDANYAATEMEGGRNIVVGSFVCPAARHEHARHLRTGHRQSGRRRAAPHRPMYHGDTLYGETTVLGVRRSRSAPMPASSPSRQPASTSIAKSSAHSGGRCCCRRDPRVGARDRSSGGGAGCRHGDRRRRTGGKYIADFGADVIKVEAPSGDPARRLGWMAAGDTDSLFLEDPQPRQALRHARPQVARRASPDEAVARFSRRADREHASGKLEALGLAPRRC